MKKLWFCSLLTVVLGLSNVAGAETWSVWSQDDYAPYNYTEAGKRTGIDTEIVEAVLAKINVTPDHQAVPWNRVINAIDTGEADLVYQLAPKPERFANYLMIGPFRAGKWVFAVPSSSTIADFTTLEDLKGKAIGVVNNFAYPEDFMKADYLTKQASNDNLALLRQLNGGRIELVIGDYLALAVQAKKEGIAQNIKFLPTPLQVADRYIGFPKSKQDKADRFKKALDELKAEGKVDEIIKKWTGS